MLLVLPQNNKLTERFKMKLILTLAILMIGTITFASYVSSTVNGTIIYIPSEGSVVKAGAPLVKFDEAAIIDQIEQAKLQVEYAKEDLAIKEINCMRSQKLKNHISSYDCEITKIAFLKAKNDLEQAKIALNILLTSKDDCLIKAPYTCEVVEQIRAQNSGAKIGDEILVIKKVVETDKVANSTEKQEIVKKS